jgi:hypothetical protein
MDDTEEIRKIIKDALHRASYDWDNTNLMVTKILQRLEEKNFKIVKKMSIGGSIG